MPSPESFAHTQAVQKQSTADVQRQSKRSSSSCDRVSQKSKVESLELGPQARHRPFFVVLTFVMCTLVLVLEFYENGRGADMEPTDKCHYRLAAFGTLFCASAFSANPLFGPSTDVLVRMGASHGVRTVANREFWRLISPVYLHGGVLHYILNMMVLFRFGLAMERMHGFLKVGAVYLLSGVFGVLMGLALSPHTVKVGASGAIFGLFGALLGEVLQNWGLYRHPCSTALQLALSAVLQLMLGTAPMIDNFAHCSGFFMGFHGSLLLLVLQRKTPTGADVATRCHQRCIQAIAAACIATCMLAGLVAVFGPWDVLELCPKCRWISCVPFPWGCDASLAGSCLWDCSTTELAGCSGLASWVGSAWNGSVALDCPIRWGSERVDLWPVDVSNWGSQALLMLCRDFCP